MTAASPHYPVLMNEVVHALAPKDGGCYVDATFGAGGYTRALLEVAACTVWAIDRDPNVRKHCDALEQDFPGRVTLLQGCFGDMEELLVGVGVDNIDGIAIDLGVSSMQLDEPARGFSFRTDGPLDMRMAQHGMSAADVVNTMAESELADIIYQYGEERASRKIARAIVELRDEKPFERTSDLANLVRRIVRKSKDGIDPATRTFQALRIHVNDELGEVERGLRAAEALLSPGGRLAVSPSIRWKTVWLNDFSGNAAAISPEDHGICQWTYRNRKTSRLSGSPSEAALRQANQKSERTRGRAQRVSDGRNVQRRHHRM